MSHSQGDEGEYTVEKDDSKIENNAYSSDNEKEQSENIVVSIFMKILDFYNRKEVTKKDF